MPNAITNKLILHSFEYYISLGTFGPYFIEVIKLQGKNLEPY